MIAPLLCRPRDRMISHPRTRAALRPWRAMALAMACAIAVAASIAAIAQPQTAHVTSKFVLAGCQALVENDPNGNTMQMGACAGAVGATLDLGKADRHLCHPNELELIQAARTVIAYFDEQPSLQSQPFGPVAMRALKARWGCRR